MTLVRSIYYIERPRNIYTYMYIAYVLWRLKHNIYVHIHCRNIYSRYSKPCLIQHLYYPLPCVIRCWFLCPFNSFSMCLTLCIVIRHPVYLTQNFSPSAAVIWPKYCGYGVKHYIINQSILSQCRHYMAEILRIRRKTLYNQSINQSILSCQIGQVSLHIDV